jgi:hypothetical protein
MTTKVSPALLTTEALSAIPWGVTTARGLQVNTASNFTVDVIATDIILQDSSTSIVKKFSSLSQTVNITNSGAGGLDTGSEASSTWYYVWIIGKADGTVSGMLSTSSTAPTMPSGYTYKARVGAVRNDGSSNFLFLRQRGRTCSLQWSWNVLNGGTATSWTDISTAYAAVIPPIAESAELALYTTAGGTVVLYIGVVSGTISGLAVVSGASGDSSIATIANTNALHYYADSGATSYIGGLGYTVAP